MNWTDYFSYYRQEHGEALRESRSVGRGKAKIFFADHSGGHILIPETPDLLLVLGTHIPGRASVNFGSGKIDISNLSGREFVICPPNTQANAEVANQHQTITLSVPYQTMVDLASTEVHLPSDGDFGRLHARAQNDVTMVQLLTQLWRESKQQEPWTALATEGLILQITSTLLRLRGGRKDTHRGQLTGWQIQRVTDYAKSKLDQDLALAELAGLCNLSPQYFCSAFTATTGCPPHQWLRMLRIDEAKLLLSDRRLSILDIALCVGFQSQSSFATVFRKLTGMSPSKYRQLLR